MRVIGADGMTAQVLTSVADLLHDPLDRDTQVVLTPIASTATSDVYRVTLADRRAVLKLTSDGESALRELAVFASCDSVAAIPTPRVLGGGSQDGIGWVLYEDADLEQPRWTSGLWTRVGELAARIHNQFDGARLASWQPPTSLRSHTPPFPEVVAVVRSPVLEEGLRAIRELFRLSAQHTTFLRDLLARVREWRLAEPLEPVYCHGDLHIGNIMRSRSTGALYVIDWSFFHQDDPCFDLFQFLDATSPTTALCRYGSRLDVLSIYHESRVGMTESLPDFVERYIRYATLHLLWILTRIAEDALQHRFSRANLHRQTHETIDALHALSTLQWHR